MCCSALLLLQLSDVLILLLEAFACIPMVIRFPSSMIFCMPMSHFSVSDGEVKVLLHDFTHDLDPIPGRIEGGRIVLKKPDANSAAFLVTF